MAPRAWRPARAAAGHLRAAPDRRAASRPDVLAGPRSSSPCSWRWSSGSWSGSGFQLLRFSKPPTIAVTDPAAAVLEVDEDATSYLLEGMTIPGGSVTVKTADVESRANADSAGRWTLQVDLRRGENHVPHLGDGSGHGQGRGGAGRPCDHGAVPCHRGADAHRRPTGGRGDLREWRHPRPGEHDECQLGRGERRVHRPGRDRWGGAAGAPRSPRRSRSRSPRTERSARRTELTAGKWAITVTASSPEGKTDVADACGNGRVQGRQPRRVDRGRPGVAQGLGRRQARSRGSGQQARSSATARP